MCFRLDSISFKAIKFLAVKAAGHLLGFAETKGAQVQILPRAYDPV